MNPEEEDRLEDYPEIIKFIQKEYEKQYGVRLTEEEVKNRFVFLPEDWA